MDSSTLRLAATDAIKYWEPRRLLYNLVLAAIVIGYFLKGLPRSREVLTLDFVLFLFLLAVLANVAYCAAYIVDVFAQGTALRDRWLGYRWFLLVIGISFAAVLTRWFSIGLFNNPPSP